MIYHKWKVILVGIPKTGSTSLHTMLSNKTDYRSGMDGHDHDTIFDIYKQNDVDLLATYTSITCVRNPYDRFFSYWKHTISGLSPMHQIDDDQLIRQFRDYVKWFETQDINSEAKTYPHSLHQWKFISLDKKHFLVDHILRLETFREDWKKFQTIYNSLDVVPYEMDIKVRHENITSSISYKEAYDAETANIIYRYYKGDFLTFNYPKEL